MQSLLGKLVDKEHEEIARVLATEARAEAAGRGGVHSHVSDGIAAVVFGGKAAVRLDSIGHPAIMGAEFGGGAHGPGNPTKGGRNRKGGGHTTQFPPWKGNSPSQAGYMLYQALRDNSVEIQKRYEKATDDAAKLSGAFPL